MTAAVAALKAENEAFRERLEGHLSQRFDQRRERLLLASMGTLEALDRAIDAARASDAAEALISGVMLVRTQLFRILQEEGLERVSVLGLPYDPRSSEVVQRRPVTDPDHDGVVIEELQGGHQLRGHIIRRAKVVVGELADDAVAHTVVMAPTPPPARAAPPAGKPAAREEAFAATAAMPALADEDEDGATPTVAMGVHELEAMVSRKNAAAAAAAAAAKARAAPPPPEPPAEEPIVVEDWAEPTQAGTPGTLIDGAAVAAARESSEDESANATMVLADSAALFVRPGAPAPAGRAQAAPAAPAAAEAEEWEAADQWRGNDPNETQPVPREQRKATAPPPSAARGGAAPAAAARPRVAPPTDVLKRQARARHEEPPTTPSAPAFRPPPATPAAGTARRGAPEGTGTGLYVGLVAFVIVAGAVGYGVWRVTHKPPVEITQTGPLPTTSTTIPEEVQVVRPTTPEEAANQTPPPGGLPPVTVPPPINTVSTTLPTAVTLPPPTTQAVAPPPTAVHAPPTTLAPVNPVTAALAQADAAMTAHNYNEAIKHFEAALAAEPGNAEAAQGKLRAMGERAASLDRYWKTDPTMTEGKSSGGGLAGFDGANVVKVKCDCALTYEISPTKPVQGQPYSVKINLRNDTKKDIKLRSLLLTLRVNNAGSPKSIALLANQVERGKTITVGQVDDTWKLGTTSWTLEGAVTDQGGVTYRAQYTWDVR